VTDIDGFQDAWQFMIVAALAAAAAALAIGPVAVRPSPERVAAAASPAVPEVAP